MQSAAEHAGLPRAVRETGDRLVGGVASGVAHHLGWPVGWVRVGFVVSTVLSGFGLVLYAALWVSLPRDRTVSPLAPGLAAAERQGRRSGRGLDLRGRRDLGPLVAVAAVGIGAAALLATATGTAWIVWPVLVATTGVLLLWRQADDAEEDRWHDRGGRVGPLRLVLGSGGWAAYTRLVAGVALLVGALGLFAATTGGVAVVRTVLVAATVAVLGLALVAGPWLARLAGDLSEERAERVRSQERADVAAHLHDSVLQTLALIQRNATDPAAVARLARSQERDLRTWLFEAPRVAGATLAGELREVGARVEDDHGVPVEVVVVGDLPAERCEALVPAVREAVVNAARHSGAARVDVYAEVGADAVEVFVRDRGTGFDPDLVPADRRGVRHSIEDRMRRHGGTAAVVSRPGEGTEVRLGLPLERDRSGGVR